MYQIFHAVFLDNTSKGNEENLESNRLKDDNVR